MKYSILLVVVLTVIPFRETEVLLRYAQKKVYINETVSP